MYCTQCGKENNPQNRFCENCGRPFYAPPQPLYHYPPVYVPPQQPPVQGYDAAPVSYQPVTIYTNAPVYAPGTTIPMYPPLPVYFPVPTGQMLEKIPLQSIAPPKAAEKGNLWVPIISMAVMALIGVSAFVFSLI